MRNYLDEIEIKIEHLRNENHRAENALQLVRIDYQKSFRNHLEHYAQSGVKQLLAEYERRIYLKYSINILEHYLDKEDFEFQMPIKEKKDLKLFNLARARLKQIVLKYSDD